jgi:hemerythrin
MKKNTWLNTQLRETGIPQEDAQEFVDTLKTMITELKEDGDTDHIAESVNIYLFDWLVTHIKSIDGAYRKYLKEL